MKRKTHLTNNELTFTPQGLEKIAWRVFLLNSPRNVRKNQETRDFIEDKVSWYRYRLPVSTQEFSRFVARETYYFWKGKGWKKKRTKSRNGRSKSVWVHVFSQVEPKKLENMCA